MTASGRAVPAAVATVRSPRVLPAPVAVTGERPKEGP
jgi:hypothetical protein